MTTTTTTDPIVITGLALRLPGADDQAAFWRLLTEGVDRTAPVSDARRRLAGAPGWDDVIGEVDDIDAFDADFFGIEADEARFMDPQHRVGMEVAHDAVCDAGLLESDQTQPRRYAVLMAMSTNAYYPMVCRWMDENGPEGLHPRTIMNSFNGALAARVSHQYNLTGPVLAVDTACSSFLTALAHGVDAIRNGCDGAVVGGVNLLSGAYTTMLCNAGGITTANPFTRVFDEEADGTLIGEGAVVVVLEREEVARSRNRRSYGRILGHALNNDGSSLNIMAPNPRGQANVIKECYAGIDHTRIRYVETHGTGTRIGDPIELNALGQVYRRDDFDGATVGIGSVKTNIGHLLSAAGGAGLAKLLLSLQHGQMAPNLHLETVNPLLELEDTPFEVVTEPRPWPREGDSPRVGAITSLGLGGTNVHFVIEEADPARPGPDVPVPVLSLSAHSPEALDHLVADARRRLAGPGCDRYNLAMTLARFRPAHPWRAVLVLDETGAVAEVRTSHVERPVRRVKLRPTPEASAREAVVRALLGRVEVTDAEPGRFELGLTLGAGESADAELVLPPGLGDLELAAELFAAGCRVDWEHVFPNGTGTLSPLSTYPFAKQSHWLPL